MITRKHANGRLVAAGLVLAGMLTACGSQTSGSPSASTSTSPSTSTSASASAGASPVVVAKTVGSQGTILVAASNSMTLYNFSKDTPGTSNCKGGCLTTWPALTVPSGQQPTGGDGVSGKLGTITRDDGTLQVTYKDLPLYFFGNDTAPGDTKGVYANWGVVKP